MGNPTAAMLVIGDEILSGRTQDTNSNHLAVALTLAAIDLREVRVVSDDQAQIVAAVNDLRAKWNTVFTSGGIGPTHDDITADAIAVAFGVGISVRSDARAIMQERADKIGIELNQARLRMARIPDGAALIDNPVSGAPGFTIGNVHVMAGVPAVFHAMVATVIPTLTGGTPVISKTVRKARSPPPWGIWPNDIPTFQSGLIPLCCTGGLAQISCCAAQTRPNWPLLLSISWTFSPREFRNDGAP